MRILESSDEKPGMVLNKSLRYSDGHLGRLPMMVEPDENLGRIVMKPLVSGEILATFLMRILGNFQ